VFLRTALPERAAIASYLQRFRERFERFVKLVSDDLPRERRELDEQLLAAAPRLCVIKGAPTRAFAEPHRRRAPGGSIWVERPRRA
jgi:hypothetical protein